MPKKLLSVLALLAIAGAAHAADEGEKKARDAIHSLLPLAVIDRVVRSDLPGFYEVIISGQIAYVSSDGKYLLQGNLYDVPEKKDLTAARLAQLRAEALAQLPAAKRIVFAPPHPKYSVTVFTDVDCPYCRQFHKQIAEYNQLGIAVNYVMYPLDIHPGADQKAVAVWCAKDRNEAYTAAMNGQDPGHATCTNPVAETKALGVRLGINATPTVLADDGSTIDNAKATVPAQLLAELERKAAAKKTSAPVAAR
jgi:thiol:disulfide interchange protein DsbC